MAFEYSWRKIALSAFAAIGLIAAANTNADAQGVDKIKQAGVVRIGVMGEQAPWGSIDASGQNIGYDIDVARLIGEEMGVKVEFVPNAVAARIPNLITGKVDIRWRLWACIRTVPKRCNSLNPMQGCRSFFSPAKNIKLKK